MRLKRLYILTSIINLVLVLAWISCPLAQDQPEIQINTTSLGPNLYLLQDTGGMSNTLALTGDDGVFMVDTKAQAASDLLFDRIAELDPHPVRFVAITHWHFDHVGGNEKAAESGAAIIAHENVKKQMSMEHDMQVLKVKIPASPEAAMPLLTFDRKMALHLNGEDVQIFHLAAGHTDGDAVVLFPKANVIHMGDLYFEGLYPYIGIYSGGSIDGMISVINRILPLIDEKTRVVPGHGPLSDKTKLKAYVAMLTAIRDRVQTLIDEGRSLEEAVAARPTQEFDEKWGEGFLPPDRFAGLVYMDLSPQLP